MLAFVVFESSAFTLRAATTFLIEATLESAAILLFAWLLVAGLRRQSARLRHRLWAAAIGGALVLPFVSRAVPSFDLPVVPAWLSEEPALSGSALEELAIFGRTTESARLSGEFGVMEGALALWLLGVVVVLARVGLGLLRARRLADHAERIDPTDPEWQPILRGATRRVGVRRPIRLAQSSELSTPMTWGTWRPEILLPTVADAWSAERREIVILHELVHVRRLDWSIQLAAHLCCAVFWVNPLAWVALRQLTIERELACDEAVIATGTRASVYASHLVGIARSMGPTPAPLALLEMATSRFTHRVEALLRRPISRMPSWATSSIVATFVAMSIGFAAIDPWREGERPPADLGLAYDYLESEQFASAATVFEQLLLEDPCHMKAWFYLGYSLHMAGDLDRAMIAHERASRDSKHRPIAYYNIACVHAINGRHDSAFEYLSKSQQLGFRRSKSALLSDPDLRALHDDRRFPGVVQGFTRRWWKSES